MSQHYLCDEYYWSKFDFQGMPTEMLNINVISDGE